MGERDDGGIPGDMRYCYTASLEIMFIFTVFLEEAVNTTCLDHLGIYIYIEIYRIIYIYTHTHMYHYIMMKCF